MLSSHNTYPREGNVLATLHIVSYLKDKHNSCLTGHTWRLFMKYLRLRNNRRPFMVTPLVKSVDLRMMVDSEHAGDKTTRRSHTVFMIFLNLDLVQWL